MVYTCARGVEDGDGGEGRRTATEAATAEGSRDQHGHPGQRRPRRAPSEPGVTTTSPLGTGVDDEGWVLAGTEMGR